MSKTLILGGGVAGLSLATFLKDETVVLEKEQDPGGLSRSYCFDGVYYDIGPHIIFSKNKEVLDLHSSIIETNRIRRTNKCLYKGIQVKYPFENGLSALPPEDRDYCLREYLENPYENYESKNMLQFFLKTFGEGITRLYLQPYNEKIWKFDPSCMDMQMVERIPKPPKEDVVASANGVETEGYQEQLYFYYPKQGGFQTLVNAYARRAAAKGPVYCGAGVKKISRHTNGRWRVETEKGPFEGDRLVNCMPLQTLLACLPSPDSVQNAVSALKWNAIHVVVLHYKRTTMAGDLAYYIPDPDIVFHRLTNINYLGQSYCRENDAATLMAEITFRPDSYLSGIDVSTIEQTVVRDLGKLGIAKPSDLVALQTRTEPLAYVIYDLNHRKNVDLILDYLKSQDIVCVGRFAEYEYVNTDAVVASALKVARSINAGEPKDPGALFR